MYTLDTLCVLSIWFFLAGPDRTFKIFARLIAECERSIIDCPAAERDATENTTDRGRKRGFACGDSFIASGWSLRYFQPGNKSA